METMTELYTSAGLARLRGKRLVWRALFWAVALGGLAVCVFFCLRAEAGAERALFWRLVWIAAPCGCVCIALYLFFCAPLRRLAEHTAHMRDGERETLRGVVTVTGDLVRIRRSITVRTVLLDAGGAQRRLSVYAPYARLLGRTPREMTLAVVHGYIAAFAPPPPEGPAPRETGRAVLRALRRFFASLHNFVLWLLIAVFLCAFVAMRVTEVPAAEKLVVMVDAPALDAEGLAAALEPSKPEGIRLVQVRSFSYAFMESRSLQSADVFIVPASQAAEYLPDLLPLPSGLDGTRYSADGVDWGLRVYDAAAGQGSADTYIQYASEDYYLFFGKASLHAGTQDDAACALARALMELE